MAHRDLHPEYDPSCFGCKVLTVSVGAGAREVGGAEVRAIEQKEKVLDKDLASYQRLRRNGLQPKSIDGASKLESSDIGSQFDIDLGRVVPKAEESRVREGFELAKEMGF